MLGDGAIRWVQARGRSYQDDNGRPTIFAGALVDITDQKRVEEQLRIAQMAGGIGTFEYVDGYGTASVSPQFCALLGLHPARDLPVRTINGLVHLGEELNLEVGPFRRVFLNQVGVGQRLAHIRRERQPLSGSAG